MSGMPYNPDQEPRIPGSLADELRTAYRPRAGVPESVDRAVFAAVRDRAVVIGRARSRRLVIGRIAAVAGLAAAVAVAAVVWPRGAQEHRPSLRAQKVGGTVDPRDVNGDGVVDILDAFTIAKVVDASPEERKVRAASKAWDINGDGVVDRRDADAVAVSVVRLSPPAGRG